MVMLVGGDPAGPVAPLAGATDSQFPPEAVVAAAVKANRRARARQTNDNTRRQRRPLAVRDAR